MIDLSPQLQSKVFDLLVVHMKEERQQVAAAAGTSSPKGSAKSRAARGGAKDTVGEDVAAGGAWSRLVEDLRSLGLDKTTVDGVVNWVNSKAEHGRQSPVKIRVLHPMEREFISVEAYDHILLLYRIGLLDLNSLEILIEHCAFLTSLPATKQQVQKLALRNFAEALENAGLGASH